jgi:hypothetical protein
MPEVLDSYPAFLAALSSGFEGPGYKLGRTRNLCSRLLHNYGASCSEGRHSPLKQTDGSASLQICMLVSVL